MTASYIRIPVFGPLNFEILDGHQFAKTIDSTPNTTCALILPTTGGIHYEDFVDRAGADLRNRFCVVCSERERLFQKQRYLCRSALSEQS